MMKKYILSILFLYAVVEGFSNNITISNVTLVGKNTTSHFVLVQFDLSWDNSWRTNSGPSNWDAAWVFIKYRVKGQTDWHHASLNWQTGSGAPDGHTVPTGASIRSDPDTGPGGNALGVFIYANGVKAQSTASYPGVQLRWQYGDDGLLDSDLVEICVFGIEMVYVPQGAFQVGTSDPADAPFYTYNDPLNPYLISSEAQITVSASNGSLYYGVDGGDQSGPIFANFPKGYNAFYCMKYEISQEQYVEFLLKLTSTQASARAYISGGSRNEISGGFGTFHTELPYVACNYLSWADLAAYLDWAALRPMTELEFEKACRGTLPSVKSEFAWGTTESASEVYTLDQADTEYEGIASNYNISAGNSNNGFTEGATNGPMRVGIFAANSNNTGRVTSGGTYYGIMEMSGNLYEQIVTVGNTSGRGLKNINGDGSLDNAGNHNASTWPLANAVGAGIRGGAWIAPPGAQYVSARFFATTGMTNRTSYVGGRGVRIAP